MHSCALFLLLSALTDAGLENRLHSAGRAECTALTVRQPIQVRLKYNGVLISIITLEAALHGSFSCRSAMTAA